MKRYILKLLFRLIEKNEYYKNIDDGKIEMWLAEQHGMPGFLEYFRKRNLQLLKTMGLGIEGKEYWLVVGQRYELIRMADQMKKSFEQEEKKKGRKKK